MTPRKSLLKDPESPLTKQPEITERKGFSWSKTEALDVSASETREHEADNQTHAQMVLESIKP